MIHPWLKKETNLFNIVALWTSASGVEEQIAGIVGLSRKTVSNIVNKLLQHRKHLFFYYYFVSLKCSLPVEEYLTAVCHT